MAANSSPTSSRRGGKLLECLVTFLDNTIKKFYVPPKSFGKVLFNEVINHLNIKDSTLEYFDLEYYDGEKNTCWLDHEKPILRQVPVTAPMFNFLVKFYTPDPSGLEDEYIKYLFSLQVRRDLQTGTLVCQEHTAVLLASYIVQAELGDFTEDLYTDASYISQFSLLQRQTHDVERKIMDHHKEHIGQSPNDADHNLLDTARKVENYGLRFHTAKDHDGVQLSLSVAHHGVLIFQKESKINTFSWGKIRKLSFKRRKFLIKLHPDNKAYNKDLVEFYFTSRNQSKNFWKKCIEHHAFFRCYKTRPVMRAKTKVFSRGSSFRYSGRTQHQLIDETKGSILRQTQFVRKSTSLRTMSSGTKSAGATPKTATLNSRDVPFSQLNTSASSGEHSLERPGDVRTSSFKSPGSARINGGAGIQHEGPPVVDPSKFMLSPADRNRSVPVFTNQKENEIRMEEHLARSPELTNIPENVQANRFFIPQDRTGSLTRSISATPREHQTPPPSYNMVRSPLNRSIDETEPLPPPPPPILDSPQLQRTSYDYNPMLSPKTSFSSPHQQLSSGGHSSSLGDDLDDESGRRKRYPADKAYYIAKELLMTERTYKKDLEVFTVWLRQALKQQNLDHLFEDLFECVDPLYDFHCGFLKQIETRIHMWEGKSNAHMNGEYQRIGDVLLEGMKVLQLYDRYLSRLEDIVRELDATAKRHKEFEEVYRRFESDKVCYLPLNTFLLKPAQRLMHYRLILQRLVDHYGSAHTDHLDCQTALTMIEKILLPYEPSMSHIENLQKLIELQRDLTGIDNLVQPAREFIREGCLQKLSKKGYQQRMFFLFNDVLIYTSRMSSPAFHFKVHGQLPLKDMAVEEAEEKMAIVNSFAIYGGNNRCMLLAGSTPEERDKWLEDLQRAIQSAQEFGGREVDRNLYPSLKSNDSLDALDESHDDGRSPMSPDRQVQHRTNTTMHVCWHRNTSVSMRDYYLAVQNQISGYLLRKFKNTNGWQKLWVVFTSFCMFFYKSYSDDAPLASLPLLGYSVTTPTETDAISKDYVFKLQFKNHVYFFRAESQYTFERWVEVIGTSTSSAHYHRLFSRIDSG